MDEHWYCYLTEIRQEDRAAWNLKARGYRVFAPTMVRTIRHANRTYDADRPLFPRHGFVGSTEEGIGRLLDTRCVVGLLRMGLRYCRVPGGAVAELMARQKAGDFDFRDKPPPDVTAPPIGTIVRIGGDGPFRGFTAEITSDMDGDKRIGILMKMFNSLRDIRMRVDELAELCP